MANEEFKKMQQMHGERLAAQERELEQVLSDMVHS